MTKRKRGDDVPRKPDLVGVVADDAIDAIVRGMKDAPGPGYLMSDEDMRKYMDELIADNVKLFGDNPSNESA